MNEGLEGINIKHLRREAEALNWNIIELGQMKVKEGSANWMKRRERIEKTIKRWKWELKELRDSINWMKLHGVEA